MADRYRRDKVTGRFTKMTPDDLVPENVSASDVRPGMEVPRHAPAGDTLAGSGPSYGSSPLRARNATLVHPDDAVHPVWGVQGAALRTAARGSGPMDPTAYLVGLEADEDE